MNLGYIGIPSILVSKTAADAMYSNGLQAISMTSSYDTATTVTLTPSTDASLATKWVDLAYTTFSEDDSDQLLQIEGLVEQYSSVMSNDIIPWLRRRTDNIKARKLKSIEAI